MCGGQIKHRQRTCAQGLDLRERFFLGAVPDATAGTHPNRTRFFHHRQQRSGQPPRHGFIEFSARNTI